MTDIKRLGLGCIVMNVANKERSIELSATPRTTRSRC